MFFVNSGMNEDRINKAARRVASKILGIPGKDISPDDTIITGFTEGVKWALNRTRKKIK